LELPFDGVMVDVKSNEAWFISDKNRKGKLLKKSWRQRPSSSKKFCDPVQFVLKFESFVSNRTSDTMGIAFK